MCQTIFYLKLISKIQLHFSFSYKILNILLYNYYYFKFFYLYQLKSTLFLKPVFFLFRLKFLINSKVKWILALNFFFIHTIIMSLIPLKRLNFFFSPRKKKLFSLTRAPFVFKKSKEQFIIDFYKALICLDFTSVNILFLNFLKSIIMKVYVLSRLPIKFSHNITMTSG